MRMIVALLIAMVVGGCAVPEAQIKLADQAMAGLELCQASLRQHDELLESSQESQRRRLDDAFDVDVRSEEVLSADWVIEHRRIYSAGIDALANQRQEVRDRATADQANIVAVQAAVERIKALAERQRKLLGATSK